MKIGDWELSERDLEQLAESRREPDKLFERKSRFENGAEALQAFRDLVRLRRGDGRVRALHPAYARGGTRPVPRLTGRGRIILDTDAVSLYRVGRLPAGLMTAKVWGEITTRAQRRGRPRPLLGR